MQLAPAELATPQVVDAPDQVAAADVPAQVAINSAGGSSFAARLMVYEFSPHDREREVATIAAVTQRIESERDGWPTGVEVGIRNDLPEGPDQYLIVLDDLTVNIVAERTETAAAVETWARDVADHLS